MRVFGGLVMNNLALMKNYPGVVSRGVQCTPYWRPGNTIDVNLRKHAPIDLIYNFIHIYQFRQIELWPGLTGKLWFLIT